MIEGHRDVHRTSQYAAADRSYGLIVIDGVALGESAYREAAVDGAVSRAEPLVILDGYDDSGARRESPWRSSATSTARSRRCDSSGRRRQLRFCAGDRDTDGWQNARPTRTT